MIQREWLPPYPGSDQESCQVGDSWLTLRWEGEEILLYGPWSGPPFTLATPASATREVLDREVETILAAWLAGDFE